MEWKSPLKENYDKYKEWISPIGIIYDKDKFFAQKDLVKELFPPLGSLVNLKYLNIVNAFSHNEEGYLETFNKVPYPTYNKSSYQGYNHYAWDFGSTPVDFFTNSFTIRNPFKIPAKLNVVESQYPDRNGYTGDYAQKGNHLEFIVELMDNLDVRIQFSHLKQGSLKRKSGEIIQPGEEVAAVGCSGYAGLTGLHTHIEVLFGWRRIDPFYYELIENQETLVKLFSYIPHKKSLYPSDYKFPKYQSEFKSWVSVDAKSYGNYHQIKIGKHKYKVFSEKPIKDVLMTDNPYGEIKPINWSTSLGYWVSYWLNKLQGKTGCYVSDVANYFKTKEYKLTWYENEQKEISKTAKDGWEKQEKTYYVAEFEIESIKPYSDIGYGWYHYYPVAEDGTLGYMFTLELVK